MREQVFIDQERCPSVRRSITRLLGREVGIFPIGELLRLGNLTTKTDGEDFLQAQIEDAVLRDHRLDIDTVSGREITASAQSIDIIFEGQANLTDIGVGEDVGERLGHTYMSKAEEIAAIVRSYLDERRRIMGAPLKTGSRFGIDAQDALRREIGNGIRYLLFAVDDDYFAFESRDRHKLQQILVNMMNRVWHGGHA